MKIRMTIRTQMLVILLVGIALTMLVQVLATLSDSLMVLRLLLFEGLLILPIVIALYRVFSSERP